MSNTNNSNPAYVCEGDVCTPISSTNNNSASNTTTDSMNKSSARGTQKTLKIDIVSDNVCPWCYVGKRRLDQALKQLDPTKVSVQVNWLPFQLDPLAPEKSVNKMQHYYKKFGQNRIQQMIPQMIAVGRQENPPIEFSYGGLVGNTLNSHRLVEYSKKLNKQNEMIEALFSAYFENEKDIADIDVLAEIAERAGINKDDAKKFLLSDELKNETLEEIKEAQAADIHGVPYFTIDKKYSVSGAQSTDYFVQIFKRLGYL